MKRKISTKLLFVLLGTSLVPMLIAGLAGYNSGKNLIQIASEANQNIATLAMSNSTAALAQEQEVRLAERTSATAEDINTILTRVEADTAELADYATFLYNHADSYGRYPFPSTYSLATNGAFGSRSQNENSWLIASTLGQTIPGEVPTELMDEIYLTEFMDIKFRSIAHNNPYAVQLYLNTSSQLSRGMPFIDGEYLWIDATEQFPPDMNLEVFDFFYLADEAHNPARTPVWTELYWDPAGLGWMVSSIAPVYVGDTLKGVVGIDITLDKMITDIINVQIEETGFAFLMSARGQAIAFPERAASFLGFEGSLEGDFGNNEEFSFFLTESEDTALRKIINKMAAGETGLTNYVPRSAEEEAGYFFAYHPVALTNWSVGIVVPSEEVIAPALRTNAQIEQNMADAAQSINQRSQQFFTTLFSIFGGITLITTVVALAFSRSISNPIKKLKEGSQKFGAGDLSQRITVQSSDEIQELAKTFNQMADDLQRTFTEIETANAELKKLDTLKSQFISMASHELRTPLIGIKGYVELLQEGNAGTVNAEQMQMLNTISRNAKRLTRIVTELLDLSRIEENKLILHRESFAVGTALQEIVEEQQPVLNQRQQNLRLEVEPDLPLLTADRDRSYQVMINLIGNAIKYTPDGGEIIVRAKAEGDHLHLSVQDNGIGIKAEDLDKIFSRFFTANDITKHQTGKDAFLAGGTGLGLPIVQGIVTAHEGTISVESEYGQGSTFHVRLPFGQVLDTVVKPLNTFEAKSFVDKAAEEKPVIQANGSTKILIVDDERVAIDVTERMLNGMYQIISAETSATGLKAALTEKPDLILLDAWMPGMSGYDLCKALKQNQTTKNIPIVMFTAATQQADIGRVKEAGADGLLTKPFQKADLIQLIEEYKYEESS